MSRRALVPLGELTSDEGSAIAIGPFGSRMKTDNYVDSGVKVVRGLNITDAGGLTGEYVYVTEAFAAMLGTARLKADDIVLPHRGAIGRSALVPPGEYVMSTSLMRIRLDRSRAWPKYVTAFLCSDEGKREILQFASTVGTPGIGQPLASLRQMRVPLPPIEEQRRIAGVLGSLDDLIDTNRGLAVDISHAQLVLFQLKWDGATRSRLDEVATITMGQSPPGESYNEDGDGTPFYQGTRDFGRRYPSRRVWTTQPTRLADLRDVLVAVRAPVGELNLATETTALGRGVAGLHATGRQGCLFQALQADPRLWDIHQGTGTVFAAINKAEMAALSVPWVDDGALEASLSAMDAAIANVEREVVDLTRARDELLPLLLSGRIRVGASESAGV